MTMDKVTITENLSVLLFLALVGQVYTGVVYCPGNKFFEANCCLTDSSDPSANVVLSQPNYQDSSCIKDRNYFFLYYGPRESYVCATYRCGGTFSVSSGAATWTNWSSWYSCSVTCGTGTQSRYRSCPTDRNSDCSKSDNSNSMTRACVQSNCRTGGVSAWNGWGSWSTCSLSCGGGIQERIRSCSSNLDSDCDSNPGANTESRNCNSQACSNSGTPLQGNCGRVPSAFDYRILGGQEPSNCQYPWMVVVYNKAKRTACGGSILDSTHILTAAHCIVAKSFLGTMYTTSPKDVTVFSGGNVMPFRKTIQAIPGLVSRSVSAVKIHEHYDNTRVDNDLALITLSRKIVFDNCHYPICLPSTQETMGSGCKVMGWGRTSNSKHAGVSPRLMYTNVKVQAHSVCRQLYGRNYNPDVELCAGGDGKGSCSGDSGGPLTCQGSAGQYYQIGIVSAGAKDQCGDLPSMYTKVSSYLSWIKANTM